MVMVAAALVALSGERGGEISPAQLCADVCQISKRKKKKKICQRRDNLNKLS